MNGALSILKSSKSSDKTENNSSPEEGDGSENIASSENLVRDYSEIDNKLTASSDKCEIDKLSKVVYSSVKTKLSNDTGPTQENSIAYVERSCSSRNNEKRKVDTSIKIKRSSSKMKDDYSNLDYVDKKIDQDYESDSAGSSSEDDATVLLEKLKEEHQQCDFKIQKLERKIAKLKSDLLVYKDEMEKKRATVKDLKKEVENFKLRNLKLEQELIHLKLLGASEPKERKREISSPISPLSYQASSNVGNQSPSTSLSSFSPLAAVSSSKKISAGLNSEPGSSAKRALNFASSDDDGKEVPLVIERKPSHDNSPFKRPKVSEGSDDLKGVTERIHADLKGTKPIQGDGERVYVGMGTYINKNFWEKTVRKQRDDSKFVKDCAQAVWGLDKLKVRTVERKSKTRPVIATPEKVDLVYAMLRGRLHVRDLSSGEQDLIIANAKKWLGEKMYDVGRPAKKPKSV